MNKEYELRYEILPEHIRIAARHYIEKGIPPGEFLQNVICNDLKGAFWHADSVNIEKMAEIVSFFYWEAPHKCWGSIEKMIAWCKMKGEENEHMD